MRPLTAFAVAALLTVPAVPSRSANVDTGSGCLAAGAPAAALFSLSCDRVGGKPETRNVGSIQTEGVRMAGGGDDPAEALAGVWKAIEIRETAIPEGSAVTLDFRGDLLVGQSTCNIFKARILYPEGGVSFGPMEPRNKVCDKALMDAEVRLFRALQRVTRFEIDGSGDLLLYGFDTLQVRASR